MREEKYNYTSNTSEICRRRNRVKPRKSTGFNGFPGLLKGYDHNRFIVQSSFLSVRRKRFPVHWSWTDFTAGPLQLSMVKWHC